MSPRFLVLLQGFGSLPSVFSRARWCNLVRLKCLYMIKPMVVGLWVDAHIYNFFEKSYEWVWNVRTLSVSGK